MTDVSSVSKGSPHWQHSTTATLPPLVVIPLVAPIVALYTLLQDDTELTGMAREPWHCNRIDD